jgi:DNA-binding NarL/FixJ family response regulator
MLVNDDELSRSIWRRLLEQEKEIEVVGDCSSVEEVFSQVETLSPDVVLMKSQMPGADLIETTQRLKKNGLDYDVIALAESIDYRVEVLKAGASRYLLKGITREELTEVIKKVYQNKPEKGSNFSREIELVIPPCADNARLMRFLYQLEEILKDNYSSIQRVVGSWNWGTVITIQLANSSPEYLLEKLRNMPEVERVEQVEKGTFPHYSRRFGVFPLLRPRPQQRLCVTLSGKLPQSVEAMALSIN